MFGIEDKYVSGAYFLCLASTALCILYGLINWNRGETEGDQTDIRWAKEEKKVEDDF
jgi:hypothetical protein